MNSKADPLNVDEARKADLRKLVIEICFRHPGNLQCIADLTRVLAENQAFDVEAASVIVLDRAPQLATEVEGLVRLTSLEYQA